MSQEATFKKNGGYFIDGVAYMDCRETGEPVANVSLTAASVMSSNALHRRCLSLMSEDERKKLFSSQSRTVSTGRPRGWRWRKEFVDADGTVYHKGVEQPKLKGTLKPTDTASIKDMHKKNKEARKIAENKKLLTMAKEKKAAMKEIESAFSKQKDFLNHKTGSK